MWQSFNVVLYRARKENWDPQETKEDKEKRQGHGSTTTVLHKVFLPVVKQQEPERPVIQVTLSWASSLLKFEHLLELALTTFRAIHKDTMGGKGFHAEFGVCQYVVTSLLTMCVFPGRTRSSGSCWWNWHTWRRWSARWTRAERCQGDQRHTS